MGKKLINIDDNLRYRMCIARDQEAMKGRKMSLDKFYEKIIQSGLKEHYLHVNDAQLLSVAKDKDKSGK